MVGLRYKKTDLHVHTPASACFYKEDQGITPEEFVDHAIAQGIEVMAITDHNSGEWIDKIKEATIGKDITIFPGVEISVDDGFHIIGIFDIDKDSNHVNNLLLSGLGYKLEELGSDIGKKDAFTVINKIIEFEGIPVIAHIDGSVGPFEKLSKQSRKLKSLLDSKQYIAVETKIGLLPDLFKENQIKREPVCYKASDNPAPENYKKHSHRGLGKKYTYFKFDKQTNLDSLKQCFIDPEVRINLNEVIEKNNHPFIKGISVSGGFLNSQKAFFHTGLNSIIGGKGTGKSLLFEYIRFALSSNSYFDSIKQDSLSKIGKQLKDGGEIKLIVSIGNEDYQIIKKLEKVHLDKHKKVVYIDDSTECINLSNNEPFTGDIKTIFPLLAYSQTEILSITEDDNAILELLDQFIDFSELNSNLDILKGELEDINSKFVEAHNAKKSKIALEKNLETKKEELKIIKKQIESLTSKDFQEIKKQKELIEKQIKQTDQVKKHLQSKYIQKIIDLEKTWTDSEKSHKDLNEQIQNEILNFENEVINKFQKLNTEITAKYTKLIKTLSDEEEKLLKEQTLIKAKYEKLEENTKQMKDFEAKEKASIQVRDNLQSSLTLVTTEAQNYESYKKIRDEKRKNLYKLHKENFQKRNDLYKEITKISNTKLKLNLEQAVNKDDFIEKLINLLQGSNIRKEFILKVLQKLTIADFINFILEKNVHALNDISAGETADKLINYIWDENKIKDLLNLEHNYFPIDKPKIEYNKSKKGKKYADLSELSVGQKCNALLIIALLKGEKPVIIDQPEDALDITSVWEDVSQNLRKNKNNRQFILTTHNNCVAVASDTDNFINITASDSNGYISQSGGVESSIDEIIKHLEGGIDSYKLRNQKYLFK